MNKLEERLQLFHTELEHKEAVRVPVLSNIWSWKIYDSGYKLSEALFDTNLLMKSLCDFQEKYNFDAHYETNWRNPLFLSQAMGNQSYILDDEKNSLTYLDKMIMQPEDYDDLINETEKYIWSRFIPAKYEGITVEKVQNTLGAFMQFFGFFQAGPQTLAQQYEVPPFNESSVYNSFELLGNGMRGIKGISTDLRRDPDKVEAAVKALDNYFLPVKSLYMTTQPGRGSFVVNVSTAMIIHSVLNCKAFERFYLPGIKETVEYMEAYDKTGFLFMESDNTRLWDFLKDLPKNRFLVYPENDNIYEMKKAIGDVVALGGGIKTTSLSAGTPQQCIDEAKKAVDILGAGGGYVAGADKMITFANDCRSENLKAVNDFLTSYHH